MVRRIAILYTCMGPFKNGKPLKFTHQPSHGFFAKLQPPIFQSAAVGFKAPSSGGQKPWQSNGKIAWCSI